MLIGEIGLANFRSYKDLVQIKCLSNVNIFIGPNGAGKSNVLEGLKYLRGLLGGNQNRPFPNMAFDHDVNQIISMELAFKIDSSERSRWINRLFKQNSQIDLEVVQSSSFLTKVVYKVSISKNGVEDEEILISQGNGKPVTIIRGKFEAGNLQFENLVLDQKCTNVSEPNVPATGYKKMKQLARSWMILRSVEGLSSVEQSIFNGIRKSISNWQWINPNRIAQPNLPLGEEVRLDPSGANLTKFMNSLLGKDPDKFVDLKNKTVEVLPIIERILAPPKGGQASINIREKGLAIPNELENLSTGTVQSLILVVGIFTEIEGNLIMIEEPELHLHAKAQRRLFELIQRRSESNQIFLTTHSTIFTGCNDKISTYLVTKKDGKTSVRKINETSELRVIKGLLGYRNVDFFGDECVVFIEGRSEEVAFPIIADSIGVDLIERGIRLVNVKGGKRATKIKEYLDYLKDSDVMSYVIADGDKKTKEKLQDWQREGSIQKGCWTVWDLEFEDCFSLRMVVDALNEWLMDEGVKEKINFDNVRKDMIAKGKDKSIVKTLQKIINEKGLPSLDKPALAEKIAYLISEDIKERDHKETPPETEIKKIVNLVESREK